MHGKVPIPIILSRQAYSWPVANHFSSHIKIYILPETILQAICSRTAVILVHGGQHFERLGNISVKCTKLVCTSASYWIAPFGQVMDRHVFIVWRCWVQIMVAHGKKSMGFSLRIKKEAVYPVSAVLHGKYAVSQKCSYNRAEAFLQEFADNRTWVLRWEDWAQIKFSCHWMAQDL